MTRERTATANIQAGTTVAATVRRTRSTAGHAVQKTPWIAVMGDIAMAAPLTDAAVNPPPLITATALLTVLLTALLIALTAHLAATGPPIALGTTPPPDGMPTHQTPTAGTAPQRGRVIATRSPTEKRPY